MEQETIDEVAAEENGEEINDIPADETPAAKENNGAEDRIEKIVQGIKDKLDAPAAKKGPSPEQIKAAWREQVKQQTKMTDEQIDFMESRMEATVAPLYADQTFGEWKQEKVAEGIEITPEIEKGVKEYLSGYDPKVRNDKTLLDNVLFMEIGKRAAKKKPVVKQVENEEQEEQPVQNAGRIKIVPQSPSPAQSLASGSRRPGGSVALTPQEKTIARKMRMTEAEYAAAKETAIISELKKK